MAENLEYDVSLVRFRLMVLADIGAYPRPGTQGRIRAQQTGERSVKLMWDEATFIPTTVSELRYYHVFSSLLLSRDTRVNEAVFVNPSKIMNTVCGLERNAVQYGSALTSAACQDGTCTVHIQGIIPAKRYMMNIVAESARSLNSSYSGIIFSTVWEETTQAVSDSVVALVGSVLGTIFGVVVIGYLWIVKLYN
jgi:hypothetical protein